MPGIARLDGSDQTGAAVITQSESSPASQATVLYTAPSDVTGGIHTAQFRYPSPTGTKTHTWSFGVSSAVACATSAGMTATEMVNEAAACLGEAVAASAGEIDLAMVMGTGWAPFRGGPLRYADALGPDQLFATLSRLAETIGPRYAPCALVTDLAKTGGRFYED